MHGAAQWIVPGGMFVLMLGMGLALSPADFRRVVSYPRSTVVGSVIQLLAMPLAGVALALGFGLPALLAAGLVIVAACPGGTMSNMIVYLGKGDTALSITLTATATLATLLTLPFWVRGILGALGGETASIEVPVLETAGRLAGFTVLPILLGMLLRPRLEEPVPWERWLSRLGAVIVVVALTWQGVTEDREALAGFGVSVVPVLTLLAVGMGLGYGVPALLGVPIAQSATIGVEICLKNTVLGIFLATQALGFEAAMPIVAYTTFQLPVCILIVASFRWMAREAPVPG